MRKNKIYNLLIISHLQKACFYVAWLRKIRARLNSFDFIATTSTKTMRNRHERSGNYGSKKDVNYR